MGEIRKTNRQIVDEWQRIIDSKVFDGLESVEAADVQNINPSGTFIGMAAHKQMLKAFAVAFPNYIHDNFNFIEQGEWISMEGNFSGDHLGPLTIAGQTLAPTKNKIMLPYSGFIKIVDGKVVENRLYYDSKIFLNQLGLS